LNQSVENEAVSIDGAPQPMHLAIDRDHELVEMPLVANPRGRPARDHGGGTGRRKGRIAKVTQHLAPTGWSGFKVLDMRGVST
jgi:hypothetical protein